MDAKGQKLVLASCYGSFEAKLSQKESHIRLERNNLVSKQPKEALPTLIRTKNLSESGGRLKVMSQESHPIQEVEISAALWARIEPLLPERATPFHPLGRHRGRIPDRKVLNSVFYLLQASGQWQSLNSLGPARYAKRSTAHTRFQEWWEAGCLARLWEASLLDYDEMRGLDFEWMALDSAIQKRL